MKTNNGKIILESIGSRIRPDSHTNISYFDYSNTEIVIPYEVLFRLYEVAKHDAKKSSINWKEFKVSKIKCE